MEEEIKNNDCYSDCCCKEDKKYKAMNACGTSGGAVYGLGMIGAAVYYIQHANTFWMGVLGLLKAIVWPAFLVYKFLELFKM